jgi:TonB-dependent receptor
MKKINQATNGFRTKTLRATVSAFSLIGIGLFMASAPSALAQTEEADSTVVVVKGFRGSLQSAISEKRRSVEMVDVIKSEDIGKFPDLNLAEALQRVPGVSIDRDGGEGRQITVRGLNSEFSRTRINGLEALATSAGKDGSAGTNRGRGFDYNVFAADLFNSLTVRKSMSAEIDEGSLGATVDLQTARPFDYKGFTMAAGAQVGYNEVSEKTSPRATFMISNRWADGKLGALFSIAYEDRELLEQSLTTTRWQNAYSAGNNGRFQSFSSNAGSSFTAITPCGTSTNRACSTTGTNPAVTGDAAAISNALFPRIPRHNRYNTHIERLGMTGSFQFRASENTLFTLDAMVAEFGQDREEWEIEAISFSRSGAGNPQHDVYNYSIDSNGVMRKASFNDVDIRSEHRFDELKTEFSQFNLSWDQNWSDKLSSKVLFGLSESNQSNPEQTTFTFESYDVDGYSYDYTDQTQPVFNYGTSSTGCNPTQACYWTYSNSTALGDASLIRLRPNETNNRFATLRLDGRYELNDNLSFKFGISGREYKFDTYELGRYTTNADTRDENAGGVIQTTINANIAQYALTRTVEGTTFLIPDLDKIRSTFGYDCNCVNAFGDFRVNSTNSSSRGNTRSAFEKSDTAYWQADFKGSIAGMPYRGNLGVRYVETDLSASGFIGTLPVTVTRSYEDTLPSLNLNIEPMENLFIRFAAAKTMARPTLLSMAPGGSINTSSNTITTGNPYLDPTRSENFDLSFEYYPDKDTLFSLALFKKDIRSYIQRSITQGTLADFGFSETQLGETIPGTIYSLTTPINTPGGELQGFEISLQKPFSFLPGLLSKTGGIVNYTNVDSEITYIITPSLTAPVTRKDKLLGLSPTSYNLTFYYEGDALSARVAFAHRDGYISQLNPGSSADLWGKNGTDNVDMQISYELSKRVTIVFEGINLTNEPDDRYIAYNTPQGNKIDDLVYEWAESGRQFYLGVKYRY